MHTKIDPRRAMKADLEVGAGAVIGAAAGAIAGPAGAVVGAGIGAAAAVLVHEAHASNRAIESARERDLDAALGVSGGSLGAEPPVGFVTPPGPAPYLRSDHDEMETLAERALATIADGDSNEVRALLALVDTKLTEHMDAEERELLPRYAEANAEDAAQLMADHAEFRKILLELGVEGDLHTIRLERVRELASALRAHAKRENDGLYRWAAGQTITMR